jgi:hypothetical protein
MFLPRPEFSSSSTSGYLPANSAARTNAPAAVASAASLPAPSAASARASSSPYVVVLVTARTCPACVRFKNNTWPTLEPELNRTGFEVHKVELDDPNSTFPSNYPVDLERFVAFFPCVIVFQGKTWRNAIANPNGRARISGRVFNAEKKGDRFESVHERHSRPASTANIIKWLNEVTQLDVSLSMQADR